MSVLGSFLICGNVNCVRGKGAGNGFPCAGWAGTPLRPHVCVQKCLMFLYKVLQTRVCAAGLRAFLATAIPVGPKECSHVWLSLQAEEDLPMASEGPEDCAGPQICGVPSSCAWLSSGALQGQWLCACGGTLPGAVPAWAGCPWGSSGLSWGRAWRPVLWQTEQGIPEGGSAEQWGDAILAP